MADTALNGVDLDAIARLVDLTDALVKESLAAAAKRTNGGKGIDDEQAHCERLAYAATEVQAAKDLLAYARAVPSAEKDAAIDAMAGAFAGEVALRLKASIDAHLDEFGISEDRLAATLGAAEAKRTARAAASDAVIRAIGKHV
ncbi:MAG TPA: hypothetical protein VEB21_08770, partial [Terriglobales bacterium]|nr:hypothetical protein [Terriglobales bacterium]